MSAITLDQALEIALRHHQAGQLAEAESIYRQILGVDPNHPGALHLLGVIAMQVGQLEVAVDLIGKAVARAPAIGVFHSNLGEAFRKLGRLDEAAAAFQTAIRLQPDLIDAHNNYGIVLVAQGNIPAGIAEFQKCIAMDPNYVLAHDGLGLTLLLTGHLQEGWREQEWRWLKAGFEAKRHNDKPRWDGASLEGRTILLQVEQGYGDVFQFCRYAPLLAERGAKVLVEAVHDIHALLKTLPGVEAVVDPGGPLPPFDVTCTLMSVPMFFGTTLETIPANTPYLHADPQLVAQWKARLASDANFKVGIVWAGRPTHENDRNRSMRLDQFAPLADIPGVTFYSLQKGDAAAATKNPPAGMRLVDLSAELTDFNVTAAVIESLDLVIAVDTSVVHLAGALGKPAWVLLPFLPDWRWLLERTDSPWYPGMRLFRQPRAGDWVSVLAEVKDALFRLGKR